MEQLYSNWLDYSYKLRNGILTKETLNESLQQFHSDVMVNLRDDQTLLLIFKIKISNGPFRNISKLLSVNKTEFSLLLDLLFEYWSIRSEDYNEYLIEGVTYSYWIISSDLISKNSNNEISNIKLKQNNKNKSIQLDNGLLDSINFSGYKLPSTMDITKWGNCDFYNNYREAIVYKSNSIGIYYIKLFDDYLLVELKIKDKIVLSFKDTLLDNSNLNSFIREIENQTYRYNEGKLITKTKTYNSKYIKPLMGDYFYQDKFITMDLETRTINGIMEVYHISLFNGKEFITFYLGDYSSSEELVKSTLKYLMVRKYSGYKIYIHNLSNFDGIFLLKIMSTLTKNIDIIIKDTKIINLILKFGNNKYSITFRDSFLLLPSSLNKLAVSFYQESKLLFPYEFVNNLNISLNYKGIVPKFKYFNNINLQEYKEYADQYKDRDWDLKEETIKYCNQDVKILYHIIQNFSKNIYELFRINVIKYPTLSSLSFAIYRTYFLKDYKIPILTGELYNFIKKGYTGGAVDVYKPYGKYVYRYDVNSLYPFIMKDYPMPIGNPTLIEGEDLNLNLNEISFIETFVEAPSNLNYPLLQTRIKNKKGSFNTVSPIGTWVGVYNNNEIKKGLELGYKFKYIRAIKFNKDFIFNDFVTYFYEMKKNSDKNSSFYIISKFILNSLSGRFALDPNLEKHSILDDNELLTLYNENDNIINNVTNLGNNNNLISYKKRVDKELNIYPNISIAVSANITANARVWMSQFKKDGVLYSDTDSIDTLNILEPKYIGEELGKMKLEHYFHEAVYLAPKVYGGINPKYEFVKVKGLKNPIQYKDLLPLLDKNKKLTINQDKWYRDIGKGHISVHNEIYTLMVTDNKRELIYNESNIFIDTKPLKINNDTIIE